VSSQELESAITSASLSETKPLLASALTLPP
jgi:hypothetical protein